MAQYKHDRFFKFYIRITRKNLYWKYQRRELIKAAKSAQNLTSSQQLPKTEIVNIDRNNPFTWVLTVNCSKQIIQDCAAQVHPDFDAGVYLLPNQFKDGNCHHRTVGGNTRTSVAEDVGESGIGAEGVSIDRAAIVTRQNCQK
jgi:hypothetical protein